MFSSIGFGTTPEAIHLCNVERWMDKSLAVSEIEYVFSITLMRHTVVYVKQKVEPDWLVGHVRLLEEYRISGWVVTHRGLY